MNLICAINEYCLINESNLNPTIRIHSLNESNLNLLKFDLIRLQLDSFIQFATPTLLSTFLLLLCHHSLVNAVM